MSDTIETTVETVELEVNDKRDIFADLYKYDWDKISDKFNRKYSSKNPEALYILENFPAKYKFDIQKDLNINETEYEWYREKITSLFQVRVPEFVKQRLRMFANCTDAQSLKFIKQIHEELITYFFGVLKFFEDETKEEQAKLHLVSEEEIAKRHAAYNDKVTAEANELIYDKFFSKRPGDTKYEKEEYEQAKEESGAKGEKPHLNRIPVDYIEEGLTCYKTFFKKGGIEVIYTGDSMFGGLEFGLPAGITTEKTTPSFGLKVPIDFRRFANPKRITRNLMTPVMLMEKDTSAFWLGAFTNGYTSSIAKFAKGYDMERRKSISLRGDKQAWKVIPALKWFSDKIQTLDVERLLSIFPEAEMNSLCLQIGRIGAGSALSSLAEVNGESSTARTVEDIYETKYGHKLKGLIHSHRYATVIQGDARLGKSYLWETLLIPALIRCGYTVGSLPVGLNQFNWEGGFKDLLYVGDVTGEQLVAIQEHGSIKQIISNEYTPDEKKGIDATQRRSTSAVVICCNELRFPKQNKRDKGVEDRFHFLKAKSMAEMGTEFGTFESETDKGEIITQSKNLPCIWQEIADEYNSSVEVLALYLLRRCLDRFLVCSGYTWNEEKNSYDFDESQVSKLNNSFDFYRTKYRVKAASNLNSTLTSSCRKAFTLTREFSEIQEPYQYDVAFQIQHLLHYGQTVLKVSKKLQEAKLHTEDANKANFYSDILDWLMPNKDLFLMADLERWCNVLEQDLNQKPMDSNDDHWDRAIKKLRTASGYAPSENRSYYETDFTSAKSQQKVYATQLKEIVEKNNLPDTYLTVLAVKFRALN